VLVISVIAGTRPLIPALANMQSIRPKAEIVPASAASTASSLDTSTSSA
jgi:hypothetical protein